eukprot:g45097.t1
MRTLGTTVQCSISYFRVRLSSLHPCFVLFREGCRNHRGRRIILLALVDVAMMGALVSLASTALPLAQADNHHTRSIAQAHAHNKQQIHRDTELARRESLRDIWGQRNQKLQTLMIVDTLLFGCSFAVLVEGFPPYGTHDFLLYAFVMINALTIGALFLSVWFCMKLQTRMTMYHIDDQFQAYSCGRFHRDFDSYYRCHCASLEVVSTTLYFFGAVGLILCVSIVAASRLFYVYERPGAAVCFVTIALLTILILFALPRIFPNETRLPKPDQSDMSRATMRAEYVSSPSPRNGDSTNNFTVSSEDFNNPVQPVKGPGSGRGRPKLQIDTR